MQKPATALKHPGAEIRSCQPAPLKENANIPLVTQEELLVLCLVKLHGVKKLRVSLCLPKCFVYSLGSGVQISVCPGFGWWDQAGWLELSLVSPALSWPSPSTHIPVSHLPEIVVIHFCLGQKQQWGQYFWSWFLLNRHGHQGLNQLNYWADYSIVSRSQCFLLFFLC